MLEVLVEKLLSKVLVGIVYDRTLEPTTVYNIQQNITYIKVEVHLIQQSHDDNMYLIQNSQAVKKVCGPQKGYGEKRCEIQGGGQEMAVMVG